MEVTRFRGGYDDVASFFGRTGEELRERDERQTRPVLRWVAREAGEVVGAANVVSRFDGRQFLSIGKSSALALGPLVAAVAAQLPDESLYVRLDERDETRSNALVDAGFRVELVFEEFSVEFADALGRLRRAAVPARYRLAHPDELDPRRCLALDNELRNDVPGTEGWHGTLAFWSDELEHSPPYDRSGYFVAVDRASETYAGLIRLWRNEDGPRLGLVGVARPHRNGLLATGLLRAGLEGASHWGHASFLTGASTSNRVTHRALIRMGAESLGRAHRLIRDPMRSIRT